jgi:hypothetical protein
LCNFYKDDHHQKQKKCKKMTEVLFERRKKKRTVTVNPRNLIEVEKTCHIPLRQSDIALDRAPFVLLPHREQESVLGCADEDSAYLSNRILRVGTSRDSTVVNTPKG